MGSPRNLGGPVISAEEIRTGGTGDFLLRPSVGRTCPTGGSKRAGAEAVSEGEGNEA
jgi:hypothetical protein